MREREYRAWDRKAKMMIDVYGYYPYDDAITNKIGEKLFVGTDVDLMDYTGLKDKNGKEIYEGDIVKFEFIDFDRTEFGIGEIQYRPDGMCFVLATKDRDFITDDTPIWDHDCFEVVGNAYENQHLKQKEETK